MSFSATLIAVLVVYTAALGFVTYYCVFADPDDSPTARWLSETLPQQSWNLLQRYLPTRLLQVVEFFLDRGMAILYLCIMSGAWTVVWFFIFPWVQRQDHVPHWHQYVAACVFGTCLFSYRKAATTSPGVILAQNDAVAFYQEHFPYDELLYLSKQGPCRTTGIPKIARSKFDRHKYQAHVPRFDHFCGWLYNTVGYENYRFFLLFLLVHVVTCGYGTWILGHLFYGHVLEQNLHEAILVDRQSGMEYNMTNWLLLQYLFDRFLLPSAVWILMAVMTVCLGLFLGYHAWLTSQNVTTNEAFKWEQVHKWYQRELKRYEEAVAQGKKHVKTQHEAASKPTVREGDVTCTGGSVEKTTEAAKQPATSGDQSNGDDAQAEEDVIVHPGPKPRNIYNRGFVENWKEVLFPVSFGNNTKRNSIPPPAPAKAKTT